MKKADHDTDRKQIKRLQQIINVGSSIEGDFQRLGITKPQQLIGRDPLKLYRQICKVDGARHDPCVLDCFMAAVSYMDGNPPRVWWDFTSTRKRKYKIEDKTT